jgi:hypothetical protein
MGKPKNGDKSGEKKEGRHPDDQSFNFKNLIP